MFAFKVPIVYLSLEANVVNPAVTTPQFYETWANEFLGCKSHSQTGGLLLGLPHDQDTPHNPHTNPAKHS